MSSHSAGVRQRELANEGVCISAEEFSTLKTYNINDVIDCAEVAMEDGIGDMEAAYLKEKTAILQEAITK